MSVSPRPWRWAEDKMGRVKLLDAEGNLVLIASSMGLLVTPEIRKIIAAAVNTHDELVRVAEEHLALMTPSVERAKEIRDLLKRAKP